MRNRPRVERQLIMAFEAKLDREPNPVRRFLKTPCILAGLMDLCARRDIEEITIVKAAQIGVSEALRNVIGYALRTRAPDQIPHGRGLEECGASSPRGMQSARYCEYPGS